MAEEDKKKGMYRSIIERLFTDRYQKGDDKVYFDRRDVDSTGEELGHDPRNLGDLIYSFRFRAKLPEVITSTAPTGQQWIIRGEGDAKYSFTLFNDTDISPRTGQEAIKIPSSTPEIVRKYTRTEEQALLAVVRYNRLVDLFLGVTAYSLQNHLRTKVKGMGQIEIDELYIGLNKQGAQFIIPVQAKGKSDKQGISQILQDHEYCKAEYPNLISRLIAAQFISATRVAMMELVVTPTSISVRNERHYQLVSFDSITDADLTSYRDATEDPSLG